MDQVGLLPFCLLLLSQHCHGGTGLQLQPVDFQEDAHDPAASSRSHLSHGLLPSNNYHEPYVIYPDPWYGLPLPGNTLGDIPYLSSHLTPQGRLMLSFLEFRSCIHLASPAARPALGLAGPAVVETAECPFPTASSRPIPTPTRAMKLPPRVASVETPPQPEGSPLSRPLSSLSCHIGCSDRDLDDLLTSWDSDPVEQFIIDDDTPLILRDILTRPNGDISQTTQLAIYTDGSRGELGGADQPAATTWAVVIVGYIQDCWHIIDWYGDFLELDPLALRWTGAMKDTILEGELCALQYAYLWILQMECNVDAPVFSDSMLALNMSTGRFTYHLDDDLALRTRAVHHFLQTCMYKTGRHAVSHVRAHRSNLGNELADFLANQVRGSKLQPRVPPRHYASWFRLKNRRVPQNGSHLSLKPSLFQRTTLPLYYVLPSMRTLCEPRVQQPIYGTSWLPSRSF